MGIIEMYAEMEKALNEQRARDFMDGLQAIYDKEDAEEDARLKEEYDSIFESNYSRKYKGSNRYNDIRREKNFRKTKAMRKAAEEMKVCNRYGVCDNGHYFIAPTNCRGAYTITLIEKKANRKRKHTLADDIAEYIREEAEYIREEREEEEIQIDWIKIINTICRYDNYTSYDVHYYMEFEVNPGKATVIADYSKFNELEKKLVIAIYKDVQVRWYKKSRNRGLGANFETESRSLDEWISMANKEKLPKGSLNEYLDTIIWEDNYDYVD